MDVRGEEGTKRDFNRFIESSETCEYKSWELLELRSNKQQQQQRFHIVANTNNL